jgi:hypothetical protein
MVTLREIRKRLNAKPFRAFRVVVSSGQAYDVLHPESVMILQNLIAIGNPSDDDFPDGVHLVNVSDVLALEPIAVSANDSSSNPKAPTAPNGMDKGMLKDLLHEFPDLREILPCLNEG